MHVTIWVDRETGLPLLRRSMRDIGFADAYNARIRALIGIQGLPAWNVKSDVPDAPSLIAILDEPDFIEVTEFPFRPTPKIVLLRGGTVTFGNSTYGGPPDSVCVASELGGLGCLGDKQVYTKMKGNTLIVRDGKNSILVLDLHGRWLASAQRSRF